MRFLLDANLPRSLAESIQILGHQCLDVRDIGFGTAEDKVIAAYARQHGLSIVTRDFDFSDTRNYPPEQFAGIVVLELPEDATAAMVIKVAESFISQPHLLSQLSGRLAIVELWRVRFRPPLS